MKTFVPTDSLDWSPYKTGVPGKIRPMNTPEGLADRIRVAAFAERQAYYAFTQAVEIFGAEVPACLVSAWQQIAQEESISVLYLKKDGYQTIFGSETIKNNLELPNKIDEVQNILINSK